MHRRTLLRAVGSALGVAGLGIGSAPAAGVGPTRVRGYADPGVVEPSDLNRVVSPLLDRLHDRVPSLALADVETLRWRASVADRSLGRATAVAEGSFPTDELADDLATADGFEPSDRQPASVRQGFRATDAPVFVGVEPASVLVAFDRSQPAGLALRRMTGPAGSAAGADAAVSARLSTSARERLRDAVELAPPAARVLGSLRGVDLSWSVGSTTTAARYRLALDGPTAARRAVAGLTDRLDGQPGIEDFELTREGSRLVGSVRLATAALVATHEAVALADA